MQYQRFDERYQLRFASGEKLVDTLLRFLDGQGIGFATLTGLGALRQATVSYWNSTSQEYEGHDLAEQVELVSLIGNVTIKDARAFLHAHVTLGRSDLSILGGHLNEALVHPNVEIWLRPEAGSVERVLDEGCGLYLMALPERL